jgi:hypothetical protein
MAKVIWLFWFMIACCFIRRIERRRKRARRAAFCGGQNPEMPGEIRNPVLTSEILLENFSPLNFTPAAGW